MVLLESKVSLQTGDMAPDFELLGIDDKQHSLTSYKDYKGLLVIFICNHCPYVKAKINAIKEIHEKFKDRIALVGINSNDSTEYPDDSFENMKKIAMEMNFPFPYLIDETQEIAKSYGAVCTPDFFGYNKNLSLQYRGRLDESRKEIVQDARRDLFEAMKDIALTGFGPKDQIPSMGCSIKWFD